MTTNQLELAEDQIALEQRENLTGDVLPTVLQFKNIENAIFSVHQLKIPYQSMYC